MVYSYLISKSSKTLSDAKKEYEKSLDKAYELYYYLLLLPVELTRLQEKRLDAAKNKYLPTKEDLFPNTKFIDNSFVKTLESCEPLQEFVKDNSLSWSDCEVYLRLVLDKILNSEIYGEYMSKENSTFEEDAEFWRQLLKKIVFLDDDLTDALEEKSVYWNDDLNTVGTFVLKTIRKFGQGDYKNLLPKYKDDEDREFADILYTRSIANMDEYMKWIDMFVQKDSWETDRLAFMDVVILLVSITELLYVPSVPIVVTINEYVEIAKDYSTAKSGQFINGILIPIINYLKSEGKLQK
jgi:N utilization substance protein B